jgi:hypothetical protein
MDCRPRCSRADAEDRLRRPDRAPGAFLPGPDAKEPGGDNRIVVAMNASLPGSSLDSCRQLSRPYGPVTSRSDARWPLRFQAASLCFPVARACLPSVSDPEQKQQFPTNRPFTSCVILAEASARAGGSGDSRSCRGKTDLCNSPGTQRVVADGSRLPERFAFTFPGRVRRG